MQYTENKQDLRSLLQVDKALKHTINVNCPMFPFFTRNPERAKFARGFTGVTGEFARILSGKGLDKEVEMDLVVERISQQVTISDEDKPYFYRLLRMYLMDENKAIKLFHPHIYQYIPLTSGSEAKGEKGIAQFLFDALLEGLDLASFFGKSSSDHLLAMLILDQLDHLKSQEHQKKYYTKLPQIMKVFQEDIQFLTKSSEYFVQNIDLFLAYYYFFYITQLTLKLHMRHKADYAELNNVFFTLDWEGASKSRMGYDRGYRQIKEAARDLLVNVNCLEHLNTLFGTKQADYIELRNTYNRLPADDQAELLEVIKKWVGEYRQHVSLPPQEIPYDYEGVVNALYLSLLDGVSAETKSRYALSIEEIGKKYFLKTRGALGYMLNVSQDFLLLLTAISVKDTRKPLKEVFVEFEKRGIMFDRLSQEAIVALFDKLNLLDKKSDSGDAQYVKPIL